MLIKATAVERLSKKLRDFAKNAQEESAIALAEAADATFRPALQEAMINEEKKFGKYTHVWKEDLIDSIEVKIVKNPGQKYNSVVIGFNGEVPYTKEFLEGGDHGDWPLDRMTQWILEKDSVDMDEAVKRAKKVIRRLNKDGQESYQEMIFDRLYKRGDATEIYDRMQAEFRENLKGMVSMLGGGTKSTSSKFTEDLPF